MPRLSSTELAPTGTLRSPSVIMACASTVAVVVPSPATSLVLVKMRPLKERCTKSGRGRTVVRSYDEAKDWHGLRRFRLRRLWRINMEALLIAAGQNLKRLLSWQGWGRRPWPGGTLGLALGATSSSYPRVLLVSWLILSPLTGLETPLAA
jgi:hypothetical protein